MVTDNYQPRKLFRSRLNRMIGGVCGGIAEFAKVDATVIRVLWVLSVFLNGLGLLAYLVCLVLIPENPAHHGLSQSEQGRPADAGMVAGIVLLLVGLAFFYHRTLDLPWPCDWPLWHFWPFRWRYIGPILLVLLGLWMIGSVLRNERHKGSGDNAQGQGATDFEQRLSRSRQERMIAGVCGGLAKYWSVDVALVRIGYLLLTVSTSFWLGILAYLAMVIAVQEEPMKVEMVTTVEPAAAEKERRSRKTTQGDSQQNRSPV